jgi:hypothetical protein
MIKFLPLLFLLAKAILAQDCVNWESNSAAFETAAATWVEPACYTFSYTFLGLGFGPPMANVRDVGNGQALNAVEGEQLSTIPDFYDMIESLCVSGCPGFGAHNCTITYNTTVPGVTYPDFIYIDIDENMSDEEQIYRLDDVAVLNCSTILPENNEPTTKCGFLFAHQCK